MRKNGIMPTTLMHWDYIFILAVLAVVVPWRSTARIRELLDRPALASSERIFLYVSTIAFQCIAVAVILWRCTAHHMPLPVLGFALPHPLRAALIAVVLSLLLVLNQIYGIRRLAALPREKRGLIMRLAERLLPRDRREISCAVLLVITVAICEEIIYRGFVEAVFESSANGSVVAGAVISAAFFGVAHLYQGRKGLLTTFIVAIIFSVVRVWSASIYPSIIVHFAVDLSAGIAVAKSLTVESSDESVVSEVIVPGPERP
ncbi:MAG: CPBP family intramembrane glutamic endopeptidase [Candidatus Acidiferrales bacterium]